MSTPVERIWILLAKKKAGEASAAELAELSELLTANSSLGYAHEVVDKVWDSPLCSIPETDIGDNVWDRIEKKTAAPKGLSILAGLTRGQWAVAASILAVVTLSIFSVIGYFNSNSPVAAISGQKNMNQVATQAGSKSKLELPDGTQVWLNSNSKLIYSNGTFGKVNREVTLTGEAFFDVVKNEKIPFIIHTGPVNITVKGTAFNVKAYPKEKIVETSLVRGLIEITTEQDPERRIILKPNEKIIIPVNPEGIAASGADSSSLSGSLYAITKWQSAASVTPPEIAWISNQLVFDDESFESLAPRMERWFNINIHFVDEELKKKRFSGVIEKETIKETLEAMQLSFHFQYQIAGNELWVGKK